MPRTSRKTAGPRTPARNSLAHAGWTLSMLLLGGGLSTAAPPPLPSYEQWEQRLEGVSGNATSQITRHVIGRSAGGRAIHAITVSPVGAPPRHEVVVVAGLEGTQPAGVLAAVAALEMIASVGAPAATLHFVPIANPDAFAAWSRRPLVIHDRNAQPVDDDRDWRIDEDGPDDIDGNGWISQLRVVDPRGEWIPDPDDERLLRKADPKKGEVGRYRLLLEGIDSDGDAEINEDAAGGIEPARNFPHAFPEHSPAAGRYALESSEARAIADFLLAHPKTALVVVLSAFDSVTQELASADPPSASGRRSRMEATQLNSDDGPAFGKLAETFRTALGLEKAGGKGNFPAGDLSGYVYFHLGIPVVSHPLWTAPHEPASRAAAPTEPQDATSDPSPSRAERRDRKPAEGRKPTGDLAWLQFAERNPDRPGFLPWRKVTHPTLGEVELGGFVPGFREIPGQGEVERLGAGLNSFLTSAIELMPRLEVERVTAESRPGDIHRVEVRLRNLGQLPLILRQGVLNRHVRNSFVKPRLSKGTVLSGPPLGRIGALAPDEAQDFEWWVSATAGEVLTIELDTSAGRSSHPVVLGSRREVF